MKEKEMLEELRKKTNEELLLHNDKLKKDIFLLRSTAATSGEKKGVLNRMRTAKRQIARIHTIIRERELKEAFQSTPSAN